MTRTWSSLLGTKAQLEGGCALLLSDLLLLHLPKEGVLGEWRSRRS